MRVIDTDVLTLLRSAPNLQNLVFSQIGEFSPWDRLPVMTSPHLPHLRNVLLQDLNERATRYYLEILPRRIGALQIRKEVVNHGDLPINAIFSKGIQGSAGQLRIAVFPIAGVPNNTVLVHGFSVTVSGEKNAVYIASTDRCMAKSRHEQPDSCPLSQRRSLFSRLNSTRPSRLSEGSRPSLSSRWTTPKTDAWSVVYSARIFLSSPTKATTIARACTPCDWSTMMLPGNMGRKSPAAALTGGSRKLEFPQMLHELALNAQRYLEHLVVHIPRRFLHTQTISEPVGAASGQTLHTR